MTKGVMVIGGGVAGIQAALDMAQAGFKVHLVEKTASIGGRMAQLDKTLPTNDCSICILSPNLVAAARHPNINILALSELEEVRGEAGNFSVKVRSKATRVDWDKCNGCGLCAEQCPVTVKSEFEMGQGLRKAIYRPFPQAVPNRFSIEKACGGAPCKLACPAGVNAQAYVQLIGSKKYKEAADVIRENNPFVSVCGRICHHPCETDCNRAGIDEPVAIRALKRFAADWVMEHGEPDPEPALPTSGRKVAIVGAGPSGLSCANKLIDAGHAVTVFDEGKEPGGMLLSCIPEFRMPVERTRYDIDRIIKKGVVLEMGKSLGNGISLAELRSNYDAVYLAVGIQNPSRLELPGHDSAGFMYGLDFLRRLREGLRVDEIGDRVVVIGCGNTAMDAARAAFRCGAREVGVVYRRTRAEAPASDEEIRLAQEEGITFTFLAAPVKVLRTKDNAVSGLQCLRMRLGEPDDSGRRRPVPIDGTEFEVPCDTVIVAVGQEPAAAELEGIVKTSDGRIQADELTLQTSLPSIFAGGDIVRGPRSVVEAVRDGNIAAESIKRFLEGRNLEEGRRPSQPLKAEAPGSPAKSPRTPEPALEPEQRKRSLGESDLTYGEKEALSEAGRCLSCRICSECMECVKACAPGAILHDQEDTVHELEVGAIVVGTGFDEINPDALTRFGHGQYENVVTGLEFERILSASGPTAGKVVRPSDGKIPESVLFIQCVGSRDVTGGCMPYCSRVCCVYAIKEAMIAKEHEPRIKNLTLCYIDIRAYGKGFEEYYTRGEEETGINFVRAHPSKVTEDPLTRDLFVHIENPQTGRPEKLQASMVVLSSAMVPSAGISALAKTLEVELDEQGFFKELSLPGKPLSSTREGIYLCGLASGPKDIPDSVAQASGAAALAASHVAAHRQRPEPIAAEPVDVEGEPRVGVFVCHCGINIHGVVDTVSVAEYARSLPFVEYADDTLFTCSDDTQKKIQDTIKEKRLNRVVVASCTPRTHEPIFRETCERAGLNPYLFEMANIRDQCSWVHMHEPAKATVKARDLVRMAVHRAARLKPLEAKSVPMEPRSLVIGGGPAGIQAALDMDRQGFDVVLIEKQEQLGGMLRDVGSLYPTSIKAGDLLDGMLAQLSRSKVNVLTGTSLSGTTGFVGNFEVALDGPREMLGKAGVNGSGLKVGTIVIATGAQSLKPEGDYGYGRYDNVLTTVELEQRLARADGFLDGAKKNPTVAFIQCVGSRGERGNSGCSRICCQVAIKQAHELRKQGANVAVLHKDVRAYSKGMEEFYRDVRGEGVVFIHRGDLPPVVEGEGPLATRVMTRDPFLGPLELEVDYVVLSTALVPRAEETAKLQEILKIPLGSDGFFMERHVKLGPVETNTEGVFIAGCAQGPKDIQDTLAQASAAASKASALMAFDEIALDPIVSTVDERLCVGCGTCEEVCEFNAPVVEDRHGVYISSINPALCKGCGTCVVSCPSGAIQSQHYSNDQVETMIDSALEVCK